MASQGSQRSYPDRLCLPLSKFSYATSSRSSEGQIPWIHLSSKDDLFVVFDNHAAQNAAGALERRRHFKVLQDPNVFEDIDLEVLASEAQRAAAEVKALQDARINPQIAILVRKPCIAIKYPINNEMFRRFQVRFTQQEHFYETMSILTRAGVPVLEAGSMSNKQNEQALQRPITAGAPQASQAEPFQLQRPPVSANTYQPSARTVIPPSIVQRHIMPQDPMVSVARPSYQPITVQPSPFTSRGQYSQISRPTEVSMLPAHMSSGAGGHQTTPSFSISSQPQHVLPSGISTYTPRPSTAPEIATGHRQEVMPPRRELPFARKEKHSGAVSKENNAETNPWTETQPPDSTAEVNILQPGVETGSTSVGEIVKKPIAKSRKRAAPKPKKAPAPKKPKIDTGPKKPTLLAPREGTLVPSAEELVSHSKDLLPTLDTQALYARAAAKSAATKKRTTSSSLQVTQCFEPGEVDDTTTANQTTTSRNYNTRSKSQQTVATVQISQEPAARSTHSQNQPCNPADQLAEPSTRTAHVSLPSNTTDHTPPPYQTSEPQCNPKTTPPTPSNPPSPGTPPTSLPADPAPSLTPLNLDTHPFFTAAKSKLQDFTSLPTREQHDLLETFICQSLDDPNFSALCKTMNGVWSRSLCLKQ